MEIDADRHAAHAHDALAQANSSAGHCSLERRIFENMRSVRSRVASDNMEVEKPKPTVEYISDSIFTEEGIYDNVWYPGRHPEVYL
jgi:hypothetical protein